MQTGSATLKVTDERDADQFGDEPIVVHDHDYDGDLGEVRVLVIDVEYRTVYEPVEPRVVLVKSTGSGLIPQIAPKP